jgi:hypothetical protein
MCVLLRCVYVCVHVCTYVCVYVRTCMCVYMYVYVVRMYVHIILCVRMCVLMSFVQMHPRDIMQGLLPPSADILCTHPMFGPRSAGGAQGLAGKIFMYDIIRVRDTARYVMN